MNSASPSTRIAFLHKASSKTLLSGAFMKNSAVPVLRSIRLAGRDGFSSLKIRTFLRFSRVAMTLLCVATKSCFLMEARMCSINLRICTWLRWFSGSSSSST